MLATRPRLLSTIRTPMLVTQSFPRRCHLFQDFSLPVVGACCLEAVMKSFEPLLVWWIHLICQLNLTRLFAVLSPFPGNSRLFFLSSCKCVGSLNSISFSHSYLPCDWGKSKETVLDLFPFQAALWKRFVFLRSWAMFHLLPIVLNNWMFGLWLRVLSDCYCRIGQVINTNYMVN